MAAPDGGHCSVSFAEFQIRLRHRYLFRNSVIAHRDFGTGRAYPVTSFFQSIIGGHIFPLSVLLRSGTRSSALAERPRDASCLLASTVQCLQICHCVQLNFVLFSSAQPYRLAVINKIHWCVSFRCDRIRDKQTPPQARVTRANIVGRHWRVGRQIWQPTLSADNVGCRRLLL